MAETILEVKNLTKFYSKSSIFENIHLEIQIGEIFGLVGLNGAGKTTLFKCILQFAHAFSGEIFYRGRVLTPEVVHAHIGFLPEFYLPPSELTGEEFLRLMSYGASGEAIPVDYLLKKTGLQPNKKIADYSRGMIQRLGLATALLKDPEFIMLDEPTLGLDPLARVSLIAWLKELNLQGKTIFLSSHDLSQIEKLCHRLAILHGGKIRYIGTPDGFISRHSTDSLEDAYLKEILEDHA